MANGKYPIVPYWDVTKRTDWRNRESLKKNGITYLSNVHNFDYILERSPRLKRYMLSRALKIRSNIISQIPASKDPRSNGRQDAKSSVGIRQETPGGWHKNRATYLITDESRRGAVRVIDYLSQFDGEIRDKRRKGDRAGAPTRKRISEKAIDHAAI